MKALSLCKLSDKEEGEARVQAVLYTAGIILSFVGVAGLLILLRAGGAQIGWGFQLQNPVVIMVLAYLFFVIGLNLSGFFEISSRFAGIGQNLLKGSKHSQAFFMGVLATIVATPCTAPFMGAAMGYALLQGPAVALSVFAALGFGLAFPYVLLSYVPALRRKLPRPGTWMEVFRRLLAIPMFLTVGWLVWVYAMQVTGQAVIVLLAGLALMIAAFAIGRRHHILGGLVLAALALAGPAAYHPMIAMPAAGAHDSYSPDRLATALETGNPVFVNMTAAWCITCKVNEKVALGTDATHALFAAENVTYLEGDWTNQDPAITAYLAEFGRSGVPLYVFYGAPDKATGQRPEPVVLPQLLTPGIIAAHIRGENEP
jgi:thiol:disulfide interchange protein DsbD